MAKLNLKEKVLSVVSLFSILMLFASFATTGFAGQEDEITTAAIEPSDAAPPYTDDAVTTSIVESEVPLTTYYEQLPPEESSAFKITFFSAAAILLVAGIFHFRKLDKEKDYLI